ncbi:helix-turn-helix transcriptional regulator [Pseudoduganella sp. LjRoot289]|uniref:helix-turn-helix domain-containing protein n=1 Tax=Pseudoduganella sp. LjRoot289 TaxID=3342314 RepID=UPI003ED1127D
MPSFENINPKTSFGLRLRELRLQAGFSQETLGDLAGLDRTYISSCERGRRNATLEALHKLAAALDVSPSTLLELPGSASSMAPVGGRK